jgi:hypothetical protein
MPAFIGVQLRRLQKLLWARHATPQPSYPPGSGDRTTRVTAVECFAGTDRRRDRLMSKARHVDLSTVRADTVISCPRSSLGSPATDAVSCHRHGAHAELSACGVSVRYRPSVGLTTQPPIASVGAQHLHHTDVASANRGGQGGAIGTAAAQCERQLLRAEGQRPLEQLLVTAAIRR